MGRYGIGDTTQHRTGFTTNTVRDVALHQSIATAFRHRYHRPHFFSRDLTLSHSLSLSRKAAAGIRCAEVQCGVLEAPSPQKISLFSYREKFEVDWFRVFNPTSRKRSFPLFSFFAKKVSRRCSVAQNT
jgi:hypothetical protein